MKLRNLLHEKINELDFHDEEILKRITKAKDKLERMGFKQETYEDPEFEATDDNSEILLFYVHPVFNALFFVKHEKEHEQHRCYFEVEIDKKRTFSQKDESLIKIDSHVSQNIKTVDDVINAIDSFSSMLDKLSELVDWYMDVTGDFGNIKLEVYRTPFGAKGVEFPSSINAIADKFTFR